MNGILTLGRTRGSWWSSHFLVKMHVFKLLSAIKVQVVDKMMQSTYVLFYMLRGEPLSVKIRQIQNFAVKVDNSISFNF